MRRLLGLLLLAGCGARPAPKVALPFAANENPELRATPPEIGETPPVVPVVRSAELPNGMRILVMERPELPLVTLNWASFGARDDPHGPGLAALTAASLQQGTTLDDGRVLAHVRVSGDVLKVNVTADGTILSVHAPSSSVAGALDVLAATVRRPTLTAAGIEAARADHLEMLSERGTQVTRLLRDAAVFALYGEEHYAQDAAGNRANVLGFTAEAVRDFYAQRFTPNSSALVAAGAVTFAEVVQLAQREFGDWPAGVPPVPAPPLEPLEPSKPIQALRSGSTEAWIALALPCPPAGSAEEADFEVLGMVLADLPLSRTHRLLRHERGLSYAARARCESNAARGTFWIEFAVDAEQAGSAIELVRDEVERVKREEVPRSELELAKIQLLARFSAAFSTNHGAAQSLAADFMKGHTTASIANWVERVRSATGSRLLESAKLYFKGQLGIAVYGLPERLEPGLTALGPFEWRTPPKPSVE